MNRYDPDHTPPPAQWLALDEQERIRLVAAHHRAARVKLPRLQAHAAFHVIVENQLAENLPSVVRAMGRLRAEGLTRHEAIHAIASVLAEHLHETLSAKDDGGDAQARYDAAIERLNAKRWRAG